MDPVVEPGALDETLSRIASQYDDLPYESKPFTKSHPVLVAGIARIFGLDAPRLETARVLELGCASGGNLIPHAVRYPHASFLGVDIGVRQVEDAGRRIAAHKLKNIEIRCQSITEIGRDAGMFDYIIAHGVYSWVPAPVRESLLRICRDNLKPDGIAYVSYNVYPGWRMYQPLRDAFRLMIPENLPGRDRVRMARELMAFMKQHTPDRSSYGGVLREAPDRLEGFPDDYLFHEYMEDTNFPCTFSDFVEAAQRHGLGYLAECDINFMLPESFGPQFAEALRKRSTDDVNSVEQMMDVLTGRTFRQTLLVHKERLPQVNRRLTPECIEGLHFIVPHGMTLERNGDSIRLCDSAGRQLNSSVGSVAVGIERMLAKFPGSVTIDECAAGMDPHQRNAVADAMFRMVIAGMVQVSVAAFPSGKPGKLPKAIPLARGDAAMGMNLTANLRHEPVMMDAAAMELVPLLNGKNDRERLTRKLVEAVAARRLNINGPGGPVRDGRELQTVAASLVPQILEGLANSGLIES